MKRQLLAGLTALSLLLTGCAALLEREHVDITPHNTNPTAEENVLRADSYQELVNILIYFITQEIESGSVRLYIDSEDVEADLEAACLEVVQEDPLGAYAVEYIKYSVNSLVTYYEAEVQITYRRTHEQVSSIVLVTGTSAIRNELENALAGFASERVLRISYFDGDEDYIRALCLEAYYANPAVALGMPEIAVSIYPEAGRQRIVEITLTYPLEVQELERRRELLTKEAQELALSLRGAQGDFLILDAARLILDAGGYGPDLGSTAYHALLEGGADSQGLSLAMELLCQELGTGCQIINGIQDDQSHFWNLVFTENGWMHLDLTCLDALDEPLRTDEQMAGAGYVWDPEDPSQPPVIEESHGPSSQASAREEPPEPGPEA